MLLKLAYCTVATLGTSHVATLHCSLVPSLHHPSFFRSGGKNDPLRVFSIAAKKAGAGKTGNEAKNRYNAVATFEVPNVATVQ